MQVDHFLKLTLRMWSEGERYRKKVRRGEDWDTSSEIPFSDSIHCREIRKKSAGDMCDVYAFSRPFFIKENLLSNVRGK